MARIARDIAAVRRTEEVLSMLDRLGAVREAPNTPEEFRASTIEESGRWGRIIRAAGPTRE